MISCAQEEYKMQDCDFLHCALKQAFYHPIVSPKQGLSVVDYSHLTACFRVCDIYHGFLLPYALPLENIKKYSAMCERAVKQRNNPQLYEEYQIYKHYFAENIVVPSGYAQADILREKLDLKEISRQAAQKKKVAATIFSGNFAVQYQKCGEQYLVYMRQCEEILRQNKSAYNVSLINDFAVSYKRIIKRFNPSDLVLWINKKRFRRYLNEAAQLLKSHQPIEIDFYENHPFLGERHRLTFGAAMQCKNNLKSLLFLLKKMAHDKRLLDMAQTIIAHKESYLQMLNEYRLECKAKNVQAISTIRHCLQDLFNKYALLTYLNGVRLAFEHIYLDECQKANNQALPTVSPQKEIGKIIKIVEESQKTDAESGKIKQLYVQALKDFEESRQKLNSAIKNLLDKNI